VFTGRGRDGTVHIKALEGVLDCADPPIPPRAVRRRRRSVSRPKRLSSCATTLTTWC
jgi:hypothetical protein